jgi:hypothetical protein
VGRIVERPGRSLEGLFEGDDGDDTASPNKSSRSPPATALLLPDDAPPPPLEQLDLLTPLRCVDLRGLRPAKLYSVHSGSGPMPWLEVATDIRVARAIGTRS